MSLIIYDFIFLIFTIFYLPYFVLKKKFHKGFKQRLGILPADLKLDRPIWLHAVSVGEIQACRQLIEELHKAYPAKQIAISTVTPTGNKIARTLAKGNDFVFYLPLDFSLIVQGVINKINPALFIIAETEIWPNLITCLYQRNIPIITVNARISDSSFRGYRFIKLLSKPILNRIDLFCVQTNTDSDRLLSLGVLREKIKVTGNMKYDYTDYKKDDYTDYRLRLGLRQKDALFVAGSTHSGEEEIILSVYKRLLNEFSELRLLIAPRHPERASQIEKLALKNGFQSVFISTLDLIPNTYNLKPIFILDTIGQLISFYAIADIVFVGGSLVKKGGHNILEPAFFAKAILFGPYMFNFRDITRLFITNQAAIMVKNDGQLWQKVRFLLKNSREAANLGNRAKRLLLQNQGATKRNLEYILQINP